jgi:hypothetical protein
MEIALDCIQKLIAYGFVSTPYTSFAHIRALLATYPAADFFMPLRYLRGVAAVDRTIYPLDTTGGKTDESGTPFDAPSV